MEVETCRICANFYVITGEIDFVDLFHPVQENLQRELNFIINELNAWQLKIAPNDGLPQRICANCFTKFCTIDAFRQECEAAQNLLRKTLEVQSLESNGAQTAIDEDLLGAMKQGNIGANVEPTVQEIADNNLENLQFPTEAAVAPSDVVINYNVSYIDNVPTNFVINEADSVTDKTVVVALPEIQMNAKEAVVSNGLPQVDEIADLEEMLKGSIIPKKRVNADVTKQSVKRKVTSQSNSFEDGCEFDEGDCFDEKPAQRLANFSFACNYCYCPSVGPIGHLIFKSNEALSQHFFDVHDPKLPFPCPKCPKLFLTNRRRNEHVSKVHDMVTQRIARCPFCRKVLRTPLDIHENSCTYISNWKCHVCERDFRQMPLHSFRAHQRTHYLNPKFRCEICKQDFMRRTTFEAHQKTHAKIQQSREVCIECKKSFDTYDELKDHEWTEHNGKALFRCKHCDKGYSSIVFLKRHIVNLHSKESSDDADETTCSICSITFPSKLKLHYHQQRPKDENGKCMLMSPSKTRSRIASCPHCSKYFATKDQLNLHLETHDARLRSYACDQCIVRCRTALELKEHISIAHFNTEAFACEECGERFGYRKDLEDHKLYHSKLTFKCSLESCSASYSNEEELSQHICSNHEPVPCEYCGEIFTRNELKVHQNNGSCLTNPPFNKVNETSGATENKLNIEDGIVINQTQTTNASNISKANVCVQFVDQQPQSIVLKDDLTTTPQPKQNVLEFLQTVADPNIISAPDVPLNEDDYFISSLLDPDNEIVVA